MMISDKHTVYQLGFWAAMLTAVVTIITFGIAIFTLPISGPNCVGECVTYPFTDVVSHVPRDYFWMYPATVIAALFVVLMVCIHAYAAPEKKIFSQIALCFAVIYAAVISVDYFIQIFVVQPSLLKGETETLALISQYNSHGIFIALECLGYLMMSLALSFAAPVFAGRVLRWLLGINAPLVLIALVLLGLGYRENLEDRFEIVVITVNWTILIASSLMMSRVFWREMHHEPTPYRKAAASV